MATVTSDYLSGVLTNFRAIFNTEFEAASSVEGWSAISTKITSSDETETYTWFGQVAKMENVTHGPATKNGLNRYNFSITNEEFQSLQEVERAAFERDKLNLIAPRIGNMGVEAARYPGELIFQLPEDNPTAFDGTAFFANTRTIGASANIDNIVAQTGVTVAAFITDLDTAQGTMALFQDDRGRPMRKQGNVIMCHPTMRGAIWQALNRVAGDGVLSPVPPASNGGVFTASGYTVIPNPYLTDAGDWYLFHVGAGVDRPFIYQEEVAPRLDGDTDPNSRAVIEERTFLYSAYSRGNVGVTDPRLGVKVA